MEQVSKDAVDPNAKIKWLEKLEFLVNHAVSEYQEWYTAVLSLFFPLASNMSDKSLLPLEMCNPASKDIPAPALHPITAPVRMVMTIRKVFMSCSGQSWAETDMHMQ